MPVATPVTDLPEGCLCSAEFRQGGEYRWRYKKACPIPLEDHPRFRRECKFVVDAQGQLWGKTGDFVFIVED
jgi:hypothetical protein